MSLPTPPAPARAVPAASRALVDSMLAHALSGLPRMYDRDARQFCHHVEPAGPGVSLHGTSLRYAAIVLLGTRFLDDERARAALAGQEPAAFLSSLADRLPEGPAANLGDLALVAWTAAEHGHARTDELLARLDRRRTTETNPYVVEQSWVVSAYTAAGREEDARAAAEPLLAVVDHSHGVFPHTVHPHLAPWFRRHVGCFADQVYPIQALSSLHRAFDAPNALAVANATGDSIVRLQGPAGQWWWHYDSRRGTTLEGYPVYTVHQDSMAPMALFDLVDAGGHDHAKAVYRGLEWMGVAAEVGTSLVDPERAIIWRSVGRKQPKKKLVRSVRAAGTAFLPSALTSWTQAVFAPGAIDWESRPYHLGWILRAWLKPAS